MMDEDKLREIDEQRKKVKDENQDIVREIAVTNSLYHELLERCNKIGKRIFELKKKSDNLENGE